MPAAAGRAPLVYLITDRRVTAGAGPLPAVIAQGLRTLVDAGLAPAALAVQLREKDLGGRALVDLGRALREITANAGARLFVNDRVDVALAIGADGVHLGEGALTVDDAHAVGPALRIALSTHTADQVARAAADPRVSFVVFGPVFDTPSKRAFGPPQGLPALRAACAFSIPVLALGGVRADQIPACFAAGASGVASIRSLLREDGSDGGLRRFFETIEST